MTVFAGSWIFFGATIFSISCSTMAPLLFGRFLLGVPVGMLSFVVPMYAAEVAPKELRGSLGSLMQLSVVLGILIATVAVVPLAHADAGWRWALGICGFPAVVLGLGIFCFPESPRWLCQHEGIEAATAALMVLRGKTDVHTEVLEISSALESEGSMHEASKGWGHLCVPGIKGRLFVAMGLQVLPTHIW
jgi:MFS family permease